MRVAVIWNEGTAAVIACQLDLVCVDLINVDQVRDTVKLNDCLSGAYSRRSELWVNVWVLSAHVSANVVQFNAVSALWRLSCLIEYFWLDIVSLLLMLRWRKSLLLLCTRLLLCQMEVLSPRHMFFLPAIQNFLAVGRHFWGVSKLLAEECERF